MAANPRQPASKASEGEKLSVQAAQFYAQVYEPARAGCANELRRVGCNEEEAEELFMATFEKVMRTVDPIERAFDPPQMVNLMKTACRRRLIDERRHRALLRQVEISELASLSDASAESPEEAAEEREAVAMGREAVLSLPERDQIVFRQRHQMNLSPEEIQRNVPGLSARAYRKAMQRANARVFAAFEQIDNGERCKQMEQVLLQRHISDLTSDREARLVEAHLKHCLACQQAHARMRGYLHDVASSLAVMATLASVDSSGVGAQALDRIVAAASDGWQGVGDATRALRERVRELALRAVGALPGSNGDAAFGQAVGVSGVKIASICAAGAAAATCLAAGVVPGVGGIGLLNHHERQPAANVVKKVAPSVSQHGLIDTLPTAIEPTTKTSNSPSGTRTAKQSIGHSSHGSGSTTASAPASSASSATTSGRQTGTEFGFESGSAPSSSAPAPAPTSTHSSSSGTSGSSHSGGGKAEFGL